MHPKLKEFLRFEWMISPLIIQIVFWIGVVICIISGVWTMFVFGILKGLWIVIFGPIVLRIFCEAGILIFRINDNIAAIKTTIVKQ